VRFQNPANTISISWHIDDVKQERPDLTDEQCREVLADCKERHYAIIGLNWGVIRIVADDFFPEPDGDEAPASSAGQATKADGGAA
jgi:hypothetical protein